MINQRGISHPAIAAILSSALLSAFAGCSSSADTRAATPAPRPMATARSVSSLDFLDALESKPAASADDVLRALTIAMGSEPPAEYQTLRQRSAGLGWIDSDYPTSGNAVVSSTVAADAIARAGALQRPAGPGTALPAMAAEGWLSKAAAAKPTLSGADVLAAVSAAADYKAARTNGKPVSPKPMVMRPPAQFVPPVSRTASAKPATDVARTGTSDQWPPTFGPAPASKPATNTPPATTTTPATDTAAKPAAIAASKPARETFEDEPPAAPAKVAAAATAAKNTPIPASASRKPPRPAPSELTSTGKFPKPRPEPLPDLPKQSGGGDSVGGEQ